MKLAIWMTALVLAAGGGAASAAPAESGAPAPAAATAKAKATDPATLSLLKRMCDRLATAKTFTARGRASLELPTEGGMLVTVFNDFDIAVRRPDGLVAHRRGDLPEFRFAFDGKTMTVLVPGTGKWGTTSAPATLDAMLPAADEQGGLNMPFDEFLVADPCAAITAGNPQAAWGPPAVIHGKKVEHLLLSSAQLQLEYWIDPATALPARSLVVYLDQPARPHFFVEYAEWKLDPKLPESTFALPKPKGASQVDFRDAASAFR
jgi:hypothetical protein